MDGIGFVDLIQRCYNRFVAAVFSFTMMVVDLIQRCYNRFVAAVVSFTMMVREKPYWLRLALAIFGICLYSADIGSDIFVGVDLIERCHNRYAASVFSFTIMPGFLLAFIFICSLAFDDGCSWKLFLVLLVPLGAALGGILLIPAGLVVLIWSAIKLDSSGSAKGAKE